MIVIIKINCKWRNEKIKLWKIGYFQSKCKWIKIKNKWTIKINYKLKINNKWIKRTYWWTKRIDKLSKNFIKFLSRTKLQKWIRYKRTLTKKHTRFGW